MVMECDCGGRRPRNVNISILYLTPVVKGCFCATACAYRETWRPGDTEKWKGISREVRWFVLIAIAESARWVFVCRQLQ